MLGLCATGESARRLSAGPFPALASDITARLSAPDGWASPELLVHCASSRGGDADSYRAVYRDGLENVLCAFDPARVLFTGSTSVYSQADGSLVTEESPADPKRETGAILLQAEALAQQAGGIVARLAGIYGPGRSALLKNFLDGSARLENGGGRWINQIHRDDAAAALLRLADAAVASGVYNVCDDTPCTQRDVYRWISGHLRRPLPPEGPADPDSRHGGTCRRVSNAKLRATGWTPAFPSYRDALAALVGAQAVAPPAIPIRP